MLTALDRPVYYAAMVKKRDTKTELIKVGMELIGTQGYNATGIGAVLKQAGVPKGSFYHHFESKEEFGLTIIEMFTEKFLKRLDVYLSDDSLTPLNRLRTFLEKGLEQAESHQFTTGCLIGDLAQELAAQNERLRIRLDKVMRSWGDRFAVCLREAQQAGEVSPATDPDKVAGLILTGWEGALLRAKVMKSSQPVRDFIDTLFTTVLKTP